ncbi:cation:proton antiporter [Egicoccus sp. AB-alg6-2]|uniref:cation:proton antiporter domain-containing protein n=1 Tax=Egicoccus sp. AB-alg6-2 TaxID=3242692 RepID=UPI00359E6A71
MRVLHVAARLLLAVALMATALRYPVDEVRGHVRELALLLLVVLPAMATVLAGGAVWLLQLPLGVALVLGAALSPTDPVLASGIVTGKPAEEDIPRTDRRLLSLESGFNDGLARPFVLLAIAAAAGGSLASELGRAMAEVLGGVSLGAAGGFVAGRAMRWAEQHREMNRAIRSLYTLVLAAFLLGAGGLLGVNDLLAVFVAGLVHGGVISSGDREREMAVDETLNQFLVIPVFVLLGVVLPWDGWAELGWAGPGFVVVALLLRRLPVVVALRRPLRASPAQVTWLGWFGPIGVAAVLYLGQAHQEGVTDPRLWTAGSLVVAVSTVVHAITAGPARLLYRRTGRLYASAGESASGTV